MAKKGGGIVVGGAGGRLVVSIQPLSHSHLTAIILNLPLPGDVCAAPRLITSTGGEVNTKFCHY